ncbi:MAG: SH3 domain-containing protein [Burkholderiales bacterium]|nr:SH3 domain-containing protein [Anaerolineae bacterium]
MRRMLQLVSLVVLALSGLIFTTATVSAQSNAVWRSQFYNNTTLSGNPALERTDSNIAFDWGIGSPGPGVNVDNFSARFATGVVFEPGTYRFFVRADDGARLSVDFQERINTLDNPRPGETVTADVTFSSRGERNVQIDYRELTGAASLFLSWQNISGGAAPQPPSFPVAPSSSAVNVNTAAWTAQYYGNANLSGYPTLIQVDGTPSHDWGNGSPVGSIAVDGFSVRWSSLQNLTAGAYQLNVRADDGVRVYIDGVLYLNEWHEATGQTYSVSLNLTQGQHNIIVEYYENSGAAFIEYALARLTPGGGVVATSAPVFFPTPIPSNNAGSVSGTSATVTAFRLNLRSEPNPYVENILVKINRGETYAVIGRNADGSWVQLNVNGTAGWVNSQFVSINNSSGVPITSGVSSTPSPGGFVLVANTGVNIRSGPNISSAILGRLPSGQLAQVVGRNQFNTWYQISFGGITGWVSGNLVTLQSGTNINTIPIRG